jgi:predicted nucleotidyltransferase component of viral defense system
MEAIDYHSLYALQDRVIKAVFHVESGFYLTGGTCLHRFYHEKRYSDDLDFFDNDNMMFREDVRIVLDSISRHNIPSSIDVDSRDYVRLTVDGSMRVELVNDRAYRAGRSIQTAEGVVLDNVLNLCSNKICAIFGRDEPKDVFDLYTIYQNISPDWSEVMGAASKKCVVDPETLKFRLRAFPLELANFLQVPDRAFIAEFKRNYRSMVDRVIAEF